MRRIQIQREAKRCYREPITPPGFVEAARSRNLELIRRRYIIHDTTGRAGRLTGFLHNACVDLFSEVSGRQPSGRLFFARTSCLDTCERGPRLESPLFPPTLSFYLEDYILNESILYYVAGRGREGGREGGEKRAGLETQIFDGNLSNVNLSIFRDRCFGFGTAIAHAERRVGRTRVVAAAAAAAYCVSPSV